MRYTFSSSLNVCILHFSKEPKSNRDSSSTSVAFIRILSLTHLQSELAEKRVALAALFASYHKELSEIRHSLTDPDQAAALRSSSSVSVSVTSSSSSLGAQRRPTYVDVNGGWLDF